LRWAFFNRRGRRDLFFGSSFPIFIDFVDGLALATGASAGTSVAAASFFSAMPFAFAK
jgi:hypothetical protein